MPDFHARQPCYTTASFSADRAFTQVTSLEVDATPPINYNGRTVTFQLDRLSNGTFTFDDVSVETDSRGLYPYHHSGSDSRYDCPSIMSNVFMII